MLSVRHTKLPSVSSAEELTPPPPTPLTWCSPSRTLLSLSHICFNPLLPFMDSSYLPLRCGVWGEGVNTFLPGLRRVDQAQLLFEELFQPVPKDRMEPALGKMVRLDACPSLSLWFCVCPTPGPACAALFSRLALKHKVLAWSLPTAPQPHPAPNCPFTEATGFQRPALTSQLLILSDTPMLCAYLCYSTFFHTKWFMVGKI